MCHVPSPSSINQNKKSILKVEEKGRKPQNWFA
jgi:hypothetical protein